MSVFSPALSLFFLPRSIIDSVAPCAGDAYTAAAYAGGVRRLAGALGIVCAALILAACGGSGPPRVTSRAHRLPATKAPSTRSTATKTTPAKPTPKPPPPPPSYPQLLPAALGSGPVLYAPAVRWQRHTAAWITRTSGASIMTFDQRLVELHLHSGTSDAGTLGWRFGPSVGGFELTRLAAAFNGGFRLSTGSGGFEAYGRVGSPLQDGVGSIVTYSDGTSDIGSWHGEVPAPGKRIVSVRQNLHLLIDHGTAAANLGCLVCWGATLGGVVAPARSALGITADGRLVWAGGSNLTVSELAGVLLGAHVVRAVELDINPAWVAGYFYGHRGGRGPLAPVPALSSQHGISGEYLAPWSRDFFTVVAR